MKIKFFIMAGALAMLASVSAKAQTTYTNGDLFLDIRNVANTTSYLIDIGGGAAPFNFNTNFDISLSGLTTDLNTVCGAGWATNPNVFFSVVGGTYDTDLLYATNPGSTIWRTSANGEASAGNDLESVSEDYQGNTTNSQSGNPKVLEQANSATNSYVGYVNNGFDYRNFGSLEGSVASSLNLDYVPGGSSGNGTLLGSFAVDGANNSLDFTTAAVPEPSTYAGIAMGALALIAARRRRA